MSGTTITEFASKLATATNETFKKNNPQLFATPIQKAIADSCLGQMDAENPKRTVAIKTPEQKLNKLETRWLAVLRTRYAAVGIQNITLRLSNGVRYTPDLNVFVSRLAFFETKGLHRFREKGILKLKWAAKEYPFFDFYLVTWDKDTHQWHETLIAKE